MTSKVLFVGPMKIFVSNDEYHEANIHVISNERNQLEVICNGDKLHRFTAKERENIAIQFLSHDPGNSNFLDLQFKDGRSLGRYRAPDICTLQRFVNSLGGKCVKTNKIKGKASKAKGTKAMASAGEIFMHSVPLSKVPANPLGTGRALAADIKLSYPEVLSCLANAFYYTEHNSFTLSRDFTKESAVPGSVLPIYDTSSPLPPFMHRAMHDTFRPPHGKELSYVFSLGYGKEVGLQEGMQEVCVGDVSFVLNHHECKVTDRSNVLAILPALPVVQVKMKYDHDEDMEFTNQDERLCSDLSGTPATSTSPDILDSRNWESLFYIPNPSGYDPYCDPIEGRPGSPGTNGFSGCSSCVYNNHEKPTRGENGCSGRQGRSGEAGGWGESAPDTKIILDNEGSARHLYIKGSRWGDVLDDVFDSDERLLINCRGGNGGDGYNGSKGGTGGTGGSGGNAYTGDGADGGDGGDGGNGGDGGRGGHAGDGANCIIEAADPTLFKLVEVDCMGGKPGQGGKGGDGGKGGKGGRAGQRGTTGRNGLHGDKGNDGENGEHGKIGNSGTDGCIVWVVRSASGAVIHSPTRYDAEVVSYDVTPAFDDGLFEPNEKLTVSNIMVQNTGGLTLPKGSLALMPSTADIRFEPIYHELPELAPGEMYAIPEIFHGRICDIPPPNEPLVCKKTIQFHPRIELLGRPFEKSFKTKEINVQYPVRLGNLLCPKSLKCGEIATVTINIANASDTLYGSFEGSPGTVFLNLHFDARLRPLGPVVADGRTLRDLPYKMTYDPTVLNGTYIQVFKINPGKALHIKFAVQMEENAYLSESCAFQVDLYLREKLIQYKQKKIQTSVDTNYSITQPPADVLLVSSKDFTNKEYQFWEHIFNILEVSVDYWNTHQHNGFSVDLRTKARHKNSWVGRHAEKMILYPHCKLKLFHGEDITNHFHSPQPLQDRDSSIVIFMPEQKSDSKTNDFVDHLVLPTPKIKLPPCKLPGKHFHQPSQERVMSTYSAWEASCMQTMEREVPSQLPVVLKREVEATKVGIGQYTCGSADIRRFPVPKSSKLVFVDGKVGDRVAQAIKEIESYGPRPTDISLTSNYGQVLMVALHGISMKAKLGLLKSESASGYNFVILHKLILSRSDLVMISIAWEIADELYSFSGEHIRMKELCNDVKSHPDAYIESGRTVLSGLNLISKEIENRATSIGITSSTTKYIQEEKAMIREISEVLTAAGINGKGLLELPSLEILLSKRSVHFCHQHALR